MRSPIRVSRLSALSDARRCSVLPSDVVSASSHRAPSAFVFRASLLRRSARSNYSTSSHLLSFPFFCRARRQPECFKCSKCKSVLKGQFFSEASGPVCPQCAPPVTDKKCSKCGLFLRTFLHCACTPIDRAFVCFAFALRRCARPLTLAPIDASHVQRASSVSSRAATTATSALTRPRRARSTRYATHLALV